MNKDRFIGFGFLLFCSLLWFIVIPNQTEGAEEAFVPRLSVLCIAIPALIMLLCRPRQGGQEVSGFVPALFVRATLPAVALFLVYLATVNWLGFFIPSAVFMVLALLLFGERRPKVLVGAPIAMLGGVYLVIVHFLSFELPQGLLV